MTGEVSFARALASLLCLIAGTALSAQSAPDPALAGHYYLSGIRETGSELLLRGDGRFEWFLSYGAVDQQASGSWRREKDAVILTADRANPAAPLFRLDSTTAWTAAAEQDLIDREYDAAQDALADRCAPPAAMAAALPPPSGEKAPVPAPGTVSAPPQPSGCSLPPRQLADTLPSERWKRGLALELRTDKSGLGLRTVAVVLHFADGHDERVESRSGGIALRPGVSPAALTTFTLSAPFAPGKDITLAVPALREGVIRVLADEAQLVPPAFETLHLRIEDGSLLPEEFGRGRYDRQP